MSDDVAVFPCSPSQTRLWLLEQLDRGGRALTVQAPLRLDGPVDAELVRAAVRALISRHESLRTTFSELDGQPGQAAHAGRFETFPVQSSRLLHRDRPSCTA